MTKPRIIEIDTRASERYVARFTEIASTYYPPCLDIRSRIEAHLRAGARILIAESQEGVLGFAMSTCHQQLTPFHPNPVPVIYQRQLFVAPEARKRHVGIRLQIATFRLHLGPFWLLHRFVLFCVTHNPTVVRNFRYFTKTYPPLDGAPVPPAILGFAKQFLLPLTGGDRLDEGLRVHGSFKAVLKGQEYTTWWQQHLSTGHEEIDEQVQSWLYRQEGGRLVHRGLSLLMIGYATPLQFLARFLQLWIRRRYST